MSASWTITSDLPDQFSSSGTATPVLGHMIYFLTGNGNSGSVFVADPHYNVASVKAAVQTKANLVDQINALTHES